MYEDRCIVCVFVAVFVITRGCMFFFVAHDALQAKQFIDADTVKIESRIRLARPLRTIKRLQQQRDTHSTAGCQPKGAGWQPRRAFAGNRGFPRKRRRLADDGVGLMLAGSGSWEASRASAAGWRHQRPLPASTCKPSVSRRWPSTSRVASTALHRAPLGPHIPHEYSSCGPSTSLCSPPAPYLLSRVPQILSATASAPGRDV